MDQNADKKFFTVKQFAKKNREMGSWPGTESVLWALRSEEAENGFSKVFLKIGKRVLIDGEAFWLALTRLQESKHASHG